MTWSEIVAVEIAPYSNVCLLHRLRSMALCTVIQTKYDNHSKTSI